MMEELENDGSHVPTTIFKELLTIARKAVVLPERYYGLQTPLGGSFE